MGELKPVDVCGAVQGKEDHSSEGISIFSSSRSGSNNSQKDTRLSPIQNLVPDILTHIFMLATTDIRGMFEWNRMTPNNVAAVSRHWRALAISHAMLWTAFRPSGHSRFPWEKLFLYLTRSGQAPLDLEFRELHLAKDYTQLASFLHNNQHRCKHINIRSKDADSFNLLEGGMKMEIELINTPLLKTLHVQLEGQESVHVRIQPSPSLTVLNLSDPFSLHFGDLTTLSLTHVTLTSVSMSANDCLTLLRICPALIEFSASLYGETDEDETHEDICILNLISFHLFTAKSSTVQYILQPLHFPSLKHLFLRTKGDGIVSTLIARSRCFLESVELEGIMTDDIIQCLEQSPSLERLAVGWYNGIGGIPERDMVTHLTLKRGYQLCPKLKSIKFVDLDLAEYAEEVETMIASRWNAEEGTRCLVNASFISCNLDHVQDFDRYCAEGLDLKIESSIFLY